MPFSAGVFEIAKAPMSNPSPTEQLLTDLKALASMFE